MLLAAEIGGSECRGSSTSPTGGSITRVGWRVRGREARSIAAEDATDELESSLVSIRYAEGMSDEPPEPAKSTRSEFSDKVLGATAS